MGIQTPNPALKGIVLESVRYQWIHVHIFKHLTCSLAFGNMNVFLIVSVPAETSK